MKPKKPKNELTNNEVLDMLINRIDKKGIEDELIHSYLQYLKVNLYRGI